MEWNLNIGYDPGDETVNFGTRAYAESDGCIYETTTVATFQSEREISDVPALNLGFISTGAECVCIGTSLTLFTDESCSTVAFNTAFDSEIETFTSTVDGNFLIVGLANGFVHCLHIPSEGEPFYAKNLKTKPCAGRMFAKIIVDHEICPNDVLIVCTSGIVVNLMDFDFSAIHSALTNRETAVVKDLKSRIAPTVLCGVSSIAPIHSACGFTRKKQLVVFAVGSGIATLSTEVGGAGVTDESWSENPSKGPSLVRLETTSDKSDFLALNSAGQFVLVCPYTLMMRRLPWKNFKPVKDFQLVGGQDTESYVIAVTAPINQKQSNLIMISFSGKCEKFSLPVGWPCSLLSTSCDIEDIHFLECSDDGTLNRTVAVRAATQTVPKFRFDRLLMRKKFEEAQELAKNFGLDMLPVHKARAQCILDQMQPWNQRNGTASKENEQLLICLIEELDKISDMDFVCTCCVSAVPPDYNVAHSLLEYAQKRLESFFANNPELESKVAQWSESVCGSMLRLETFDLVKVAWDVEDWLEFSRVDLLREIQSWIKQGCLSEAAVIWSRHLTAFKDCLRDEVTVKCLLEDIPSWISLDKILEWLAYFLPPVLEVQPSTLQDIVTWIHAKICALERSHSREWPKIGLDFSERSLKLFRSQKLGSLFFGLEISPLRPLVVLRCALSDLYLLRSKYYIFMTLEDFLQPPGDVAPLLVDSIDVGLISSFFSGYFNKYLVDYKLDGDEVISEYIMCVLRNSVGWWHWQEAPWEMRIVMLIPHITNYKIRLECIIATLGDAPVPWSSLISGLAEDGLKLKHPLSSHIREKQKQVTTNLILKKYQLKTQINKIDKKQLLKFIIKQNHEDMLQDIAQLSQNSVEDYITVVMQLHHSGDTSKAIEVLRNLPNETVVKICPRLISQSTRSLDCDTGCDVDKEIEFIGAVAVCHDSAKASNPPGISQIEDIHSPRMLPLSLKEIQNRFLLKRDFSKLLSIKEMNSLQCRQNALTEVIQDLLIEVVENEKPAERTQRLYQRTVYLARLLMIPSSVALINLIEQLLDLSETEVATDIAENLDDLRCLPENIYKKLISLPCRFLDMRGCIKSASKAASVMYDIASKVCCHCDLESLNNAIEALSWARTWYSVSGQQEVSSLGHRDSFHNWRFTPLYKDPGLAGYLNGSQLIDLLRDAFQFIRNEEDSNHGFFTKLKSCILKMHNDQHDIALLLILSQLSTVMLRLRSQKLSQSDETLEGLLVKTCEVSLTKVVAARQFDRDLSLSLLVNMSQTRAIKFLQQMCRSSHVDFSKQKAYSSLGVLACDIWKLQDDLCEFKRLFVQSKWGLRLPELGISAKELLLEKTDTDIVLQKLIGSKTVKSSLLQSLCVDFGFDLQSILLQHLCAVLLAWNPNPLITVNSDGSKDMIECNTQASLLEQCWDLQKKIENKKVLCTKLVNLWEEINFYHHEVFIVVLEILERHGIKDQNNKRLITTFLKSYRRIKAPDQAEEEYWSQIFPFSYGLPAMSEFRLPFNRRLIENSLSVMKNEINLNTYKSWLSVANALDLSRDKICTTAVFESVTEEFSHSASSSEWCGSLKNDALFESVAKCVAEMDNVEQAAATLYFFMNKIPPGLDQVNAANLCLQYSETTGNSQYKMKVEKKYFYLATLQTLHQFGLGQPCYLELAQKPDPTELIQTLYQHSAILELCRGTATHSPDINAAVHEISSMHGICLRTLHMNLVTEWLQPEIIMDPNSSFDDDGFGGLSVAARRELQQKDFFDLICGVDDNILRARYVMEFGDVQEWISYLITVVFEGDASVGFRLRAMQCLCMLTDDDTLQDLAGRPMSSIREKLRSLAYVKALGNLGLTYSESGFESCDKKELANVILQTQACHPQAVSLLVHICVDYNIKNMLLWKSILQKLVNLSMMKELEQALSHTTDMLQLWTLPAFRDAWNMLLTSPFSTANFISEEEQELAMLHALVLFPKCPVLKCIDIVRSLEHCLMTQRPAIAALLLPYVEKCLVAQWLEKILSLKPLNDLVTDIKRITLDRCINVSKVLRLLPQDNIAELYA